MPSRLSAFAKYRFFNARERGLGLPQHWHITCSSLCRQAWISRGGPIPGRRDSGSGVLLSQRGPFQAPFHFGKSPGFRPLWDGRFEAFLDKVARGQPNVRDSRGAEAQDVLQSAAHGSEVEVSANVFEQFDQPLGALDSLRRRRAAAAFQPVIGHDVNGVRPGPVAENVQEAVLFLHGREGIRGECASGGRSAALMSGVNLPRAFQGIVLGRSKPPQPTVESSSCTAKCCRSSRTYSSRRSASSTCRTPSRLARLRANRAILPPREGPWSARVGPPRSPRSRGTSLAAPFRRKASRSASNSRRR